MTDNSFTFPIYCEHKKSGVNRNFTTSQIGVDGRISSQTEIFDLVCEYTDSNTL